MYIYYILTPSCLWWREEEVKIVDVLYGGPRGEIHPSVPSVFTGGKLPNPKRPKGGSLSSLSSNIYNASKSFLMRPCFKKHTKSFQNCIIYYLNQLYLNHNTLTRMHMKHLCACLSKLSKTFQFVLFVTNDQN